MFKRELNVDPRQNEGRGNKIPHSICYGACSIVGAVASFYDLAVKRHSVIDYRNNLISDGPMSMEKLNK